MINLIYDKFKPIIIMQRSKKIFRSIFLYLFIPAYKDPFPRIYLLSCIEIHSHQLAYPPPIKYCPRWNKKICVPQSNIVYYKRGSHLTLA